MILCRSSNEQAKALKVQFALEGINTKGKDLKGKDWIGGARYV